MHIKKHFTIKHTTLLILTLLWMLVIFSFSSGTGEESGGLSQALIRWMGTTFVPGFSKWEMARQSEFVAMLQLPVRKLAHMTEYGILAVLYWNLCKDWIVGKRKLFAACFFAGVVYAAIDEIHQLFVPGRNGSIIDVGVDAVGVLIGIGVCRLWSKWKIRKSSRTHKVSGQN